MRTDEVCFYAFCRRNCHLKPIEEEVGPTSITITLRSYEGASAGTPHRQTHSIPLSPMQPMPPAHIPHDTNDAPQRSTPHWTPPPQTPRHIRKPHPSHRTNSRPHQAPIVYLHLALVLEESPRSIAPLNVLLASHDPEDCSAHQRRAGHRADRRAVQKDG